MQQPLAERLRPKELAEVIGQSKILAPDAPLVQMIKQGILPSLILWGPPGVGKTTLAKVLAGAAGRKLEELSAINSGVKDVREAIDRSKKQGLFAQGKSPILFIDEIHRFSKSQQDSLLNAVETGIITLIGATTENPSFEVIPALRSRCQTYVLEPFSKRDFEKLLERALSKDEWLKARELQITEIDALIRYSGGDGRKFLNNLELLATQLEKGSTLDNDTVKKLLAKNPAAYDKGGEQHYDVISAFIKSIRGGDPNAGVYWLARMIEGGEEAKFIARRLIILAAEDIGLANPNALLMANACFDAVDKIGWPEARIPLAQCVIYLASSSKSNSAYLAINQAQSFLKQEGEAAVPLHLRNAPSQLMKDLNYGKDYRYSHDYPDHFVDQEYLPQEHQGQVFYQPQEHNMAEKKASDTLKHRWPKYYS